MSQAHRIMIETARLVLRPMHADDVDPLLAMFADPLVMAAFDTQPFNRDQMTRWVQRNLDHQQHYGYGLCSVLLKANGLLIGDCGIEHMEIADGHATELGYDFRSDYWNQGYATEAATAVSEYAFRQLQLPRLVSLIRQSNISSQRVAEKVGMQPVAELVRHGKHYWLYQLTCESLRHPSSRAATGWPAAKRRAGKTGRSLSVTLPSACAAPRRGGRDPALCCAP